MPRSAKVLLLMPAARHRALFCAGVASLLAHLALVGITRSSAMTHARTALREPVDSWAGDSSLSGDLIEVGTTSVSPPSTSPQQQPPSPIQAPSKPIQQPPSPIQDPPNPIQQPPSPIHDPSQPIQQRPSPIQDPSKPIHDPSKPIQQRPSPIQDPSKPMQDPSKPIHAPPSPPAHPSSLASVAPGPTGGESGPSGSFGAAGARKARSLGRAFTRALPAACVADTRWAELAPGDAGAVTVRVALDETGKIASHSFLEREPPPQLVRSVERALGMLRAGTFMTGSSAADAGEDTLRLHAKILDGEAPTESGAAIALKQSWEGDHGTASFTQRTGRTVEFVIERVKTD